MGFPSEALTGFSWKSGSERDTTGIVVWSDVFMHEDELSGDKWAILLVDTQGLFDKKTSSIESTKIFALSTLISSILIYNLKDQIHEDHLQYLHLTTEYAKMTKNLDDYRTESKSFQKLVILVRDWSNYKDFEFGHLGGEKYVNNVLKVEDFQSSDLQSVRKFISSSFDIVSCYLMPSPGDTVNEGQDYDTKVAFDGSWKAMRNIFFVELKNVISWLFDKKNLKIKSINHKLINAEELKTYIDNYIKALASDDMPNITTMYEATLESFIANLVSKFVAQYNKIMVISTISSENNSKDILDDMFMAHNYSMTHMLLQFYQSKKMGNEQQITVYRNLLIKEINEKFESLKQIVIKEKMTKEQKKYEHATSDQDERLKNKIKALHDIQIKIITLKSNKLEMEQKDYRDEIEAFKAWREQMRAVEQRIEWEK